MFETLEDRRLLTTVGMTTLEQLQYEEIERAFDRVSDLDRYPAYVLSETRNWVVQVTPGTDINALQESLQVDALRSHDLIPNTYLFTMPEAVLPSPPMGSSTGTGDESGDTDDSSTDGIDNSVISTDDIIDDDESGPTYVEVEDVTQTSLVVDGVRYGLPVDPVSVLSTSPDVRHFYPLVQQKIDLQAGEWFRPEDEYFPDQWHLYNDGANSNGGTPGEDIHVEYVWNEPFNLTGNGITVAVVDSGIQMDHEDLLRNIEPTLSCDFLVVAGNTGTILCDMTNPDDLIGHGTNVAGIIAAEANNNATGVAGIAFDAKLAAMKIYEDDFPTDEVIAEAFSRFGDEIDIYNSSWKNATETGSPWLTQPGPLTLAALQRYVVGSGGTAGRGGLGSIHVFAAGNDADIDANPDPGPTDGTADMRTDYRGLQSSRYTINVGGVGHTGERAAYSDIGSSLFVSAYTGDEAEDGSPYGITTTGIGGSYPSDFGGTSAAAPVVSGVIALVLEANPSLTWRDVQHVIVNSARQTDILNPSWITNGAGHAFSEEYGFGVIDALATIVTAQNWQNVGPERALSFVAEIDDPISIPDNAVPAPGSGNSLPYVRVDIAVSECINTESVEIVMSAPHEDWSDLSIKLISPSGTEAVFAEKHDAILDDTQFNDWVVSTPMFWDECSAGTWQLIVQDNELHNEGTLDAWKLNIYGSEAIVEPPPGPEPTEGNISGTKWRDDNGDGMRNNDEPTVEGVWIYVDMDGDGRIDLGEPATITDANGRYTLSGLMSGDYSIREVMTPGWHQVYPGGEERHDVVLTSDAPVTGVDFGNQYGFDFGDAPAPYPTLLAVDGPSHGEINNFYMGVGVDTELDGNPSSLSLGDDSNINGDDEDGVFFTDMFADTVASLQILISNETGSQGVVQGWIDFNADGDWNDAGEQIFLDRDVVDGLNTLNFNVPAGAAVGYTFSRFRFGFERGMGQTGPAFGGEVEDHRVLIMENDPVAIDDSYVVQQNHPGFIMDVLGNDLQGIIGGLEIDSLGTPSHGSTLSVEFSASLGRDVVRYVPTLGFFSPPLETFDYVLIDDEGNTDTGTVTVTVQPEFVDPIAIDDSFQVIGTQLTPQGYNVVANDIEGTGGELDVVSFTPATHGTVEIGGDLKHMLYTPNGVWFNFDTFTYTAENSSGEQVTANVTVHVTPEVDDNLVDISIAFQDESGNPLVGNEVAVGSRFQAVISVEDIRTVPEGVFTAYMDLLYDRGNVSIVNASSVTCDDLAGPPLNFGICFDGEYDTVIHGLADKPGLIDEVGALHSSFTPPGPTAGAMEMFSVTFQAIAEGPAVFKTDPTDNLPSFETTVFGLLSAVDPPEITYGFGQVTIVGAAEGENPLDTNGDGSVTPLDVLHVIDDLNRHGARAVDGGAEGETPADARLDVNRDQYVSPLDALMLINHLNKEAEANAAEGEGEGEGPVIGPDPVILPAAADRKSTTSLEQQADLVADALLPTADPARTQRVDSSDPCVRDRLISSGNEELDSETDDWLDDLAADVSEAWLI